MGICRNSNKEDLQKTEVVLKEKEINQSKGRGGKKNWQPRGGGTVDCRWWREAVVGNDGGQTEGGGENQVRAREENKKREKKNRGGRKYWGKWRREKIIMWENLGFMGVCRGSPCGIRKR